MRGKSYPRRSPLAAGKGRNFSLRNRRSGVLLHPTSLPSRHGIGDVGPAAYRFVDFLANANQGWWQMCPIGPTGFGHSPYQTHSVTAGNPMLISLDILQQEGLLKPSETMAPPSFRAGPVRYDAVLPFKTARLEKAFERFDINGRSFQRFVQANGAWLDEYVRYLVIKEWHRGRPWWEWEPPFRRRDPSAVRSMQVCRPKRWGYHQFLQFQFFKQWSRLKNYANRKKIGLIGDIPIFVAHDSADVWSHPSLFDINSSGRLRHESGVPPDYFSADGQLWGNPLYKWDAHVRSGFAWWINRFRAAFRRFDAVRLDHFIGFHNFWEVRAGARNARRGRWVKAPGGALFKRTEKVLGAREFIAEDLGMITDGVRRLRDEFDFPGMRVLQFAFGNDGEQNNFLPHNYPRRCVAYTGTHDNDTLQGWLWDEGKGASSRTLKQIRKERRFALAYAGSAGREAHWDMIRILLFSKADTAIIPAQDLIGLGSEARMNFPGRPEGNWRWRLKKNSLNRDVAGRLGRLTRRYGRKT